MPIRVACPSCAATLTAPDTAAGKTVKCPKCQSPMSLPAAEPLPAARPAPVQARPVAPLQAQPVVRAVTDETEKSRAKARPRDEEEDEDPPRKKARARDADEDDDRPRAKRRARDEEDDDEDDRPRRKSGSGRDEEKVEWQERPGVKKWLNAFYFGVVALGLLIFAITMFNKFSDLESGAVESIMVEKPIARMYEIGGKWGVSGLAGLISLGLAGGSIYHAMKRVDDEKPRRKKAKSRKRDDD